MSNNISGSLTAVSVSPTINLLRKFNVSVQGTFAATVQVQRSFDQGATWEAISEYTAPVSTVEFEPERGVQYRIACTAYTSGTITYRLGGEGIS